MNLISFWIIEYILLEEKILNILTLIILVLILMEDGSFT